jgi:hypothetical protein
MRIEFFMRIIFFAIISFYLSVSPFTPFSLFAEKTPKLNEKLQPKNLLDQSLRSCNICQALKKRFGCHGIRGRRGPRGPQGPQGPQGTLVTNLASSFSTEPQDIGVVDFIPIRFDMEQFPPVNIQHPVGERFDQFQVPDTDTGTGKYQIGWEMSAANPTGSTLSTRIVRNNSPVQPSPFAMDDINGLESVSGQTILQLQRGDVIQLEARADPSSIRLNNRSFLIQRVAD